MRWPLPFSGRCCLFQAMGKGVRAAGSLARKARQDPGSWAPVMRPALVTPSPTACATGAWAPGPVAPTGSWSGPALPLRGLELLSPGCWHLVCCSARCPHGQWPPWGQRTWAPGPGGPGQRLSFSLGAALGLKGDLPCGPLLVPRPLWGRCSFPRDGRGQPCPFRRLSFVQTGSRWSRCLTGSPWSHHGSQVITVPLAASA